MSYLLTQLWFCLLIAGLIGSVVGWVLRGGCKRHIKLIEELESSFSKLKRENASNIKKGQRLNSVVRERNILLSQFKKTKKQQGMQHTKLLKLKKIVQKTSMAYTQANAKLKKAHEMLIFAKQSRQAKDLSLEELKKESSATEHLLLRCQEDWDAKHRVLRSQRDVSLLNMRAAEEKMNLAISKLKVSEEGLKTTDNKLVSSQKTVDELRVSESKRVEYETGYKVDLENLVDKLQQEKQKVEDINAQFNKFKVQAKQYVGSVSQENKNYIGIVDTLEDGIEESRLLIKRKDEQLEKMSVDLQAKKEEIATLRRESQERPKLTRTHSVQSSPSASPKKRKVIMRNTENTGQGQSPSLVTRWKQLRKSKLRRRPR